MPNYAFALLYLCLALPPWLGATYGYAASPERRKVGAARGAFRFTAIAYCFGAVLVGLGVFIAGLNSHGSGIMSPALGGFIIGCVATAAGCVAAVCVGLLAGVGAYLGAAAGQLPASVMAVALPVLAALALGYLK